MPLNSVKEEIDEADSDFFGKTILPQETYSPKNIFLDEE